MKAMMTNGVELSSRVRNVVMLCLIPTALSLSQTITRFQDPFGGVGARATALGDAYTSQAFDVGSMYWNPATLAFLTQSSLLVDYSRGPEGASSSQVVALPISVDEHITMGLGVQMVRNNANAFADNVVEFPREYGFDLGSAVTVAQGLSLGLRLGFRYGQAVHSDVYTGFSTVGIDYAPDPSISYAFVYNGLPLGLRVKDYNPDFPMDLERLPRSFEIGVTMHYPSSRLNQLINISVANEKVVGTPGLFYMAGMEVLPLQFLGLRVGYVTGPGTSQIRYGLGIGGSEIQVAYAAIPSPYHAPLHQLSILIGR